MKLFSTLALLTLFTFIFSFPLPAVAQQDSNTVRQLLEERDEEIKELLGPKGTEYTQEQRQKLKDIINGIIDYRAMAKYALQETYDTLSTEARNEFVDLFSTIIRDQSLNKLDIYRAEVKYQAIRVDSNKATVETLATLEDVRTPVTYKMRYEEVEANGRWVVTDLVIDDVSTAESYRRQFQNIIRKKGYDSLIKTLRKRAAR